MKSGYKLQLICRYFFSRNPVDGKAVCLEMTHEWIQ